MAAGGVTADEKPKIKWIEKDALSVTDRRRHVLPPRLAPSPSVDGRRFAGKTVQKLLNERDEIWREHGRSQCAFMEREQKRILTALHRQVESLQNQCSGLTLELAKSMVIAEELKDANKTEGSTVSAAEIERELEEARKELMQLQESNGIKDEQIDNIGRKYNDQEKGFRSHLDQLNKKMKDDTINLNQTSSLTTQLMLQLHHVRLRQAVEKQKRQMEDKQARRRRLLTDPPKTSAAASWLLDSETAVLDNSRSLMESGDATINRSDRRRSTLPPIFMTTNRPDSTNVNIEKPDAIARSRSFQLSRRRSSNFNSSDEDA